MLLCTVRLRLFGRRCRLGRQPVTKAVPSGSSPRRPGQDRRCAPGGPGGPQDSFLPHFRASGKFLLRTAQSKEHGSPGAPARTSGLEPPLHGGVPRSPLGGSAGSDPLRLKASSRWTRAPQDAACVVSVRLSHVEDAADPIPGACGRGAGTAVCAQGQAWRLPWAAQVQGGADRPAASPCRSWFRGTTSPRHTRACFILEDTGASCCPVSPGAGQSSGVAERLPRSDPPRRGCPKSTEPCGRKIIVQQEEDFTNERINLTLFPFFPFPLFGLQKAP